MRAELMSDAPVDLVEYWPYGEIASDASGIDERHLFTGHEREYLGSAEDALHGLDSMHARHYMSGPGRFMSVDSIGGEVGSSLSWNRNAYVHGNPVVFLDPTGRERLDATVQSFLGAWYATDLSRVRIYHGFIARILTTENRNGITIGRRIFVNQRTYQHYKAGTAEGAGIIGHEVAHVLQYRDNGFFGFLYAYLQEYILLRREGMSHEDAYNEVRFEIEAYAEGDAVLDFLVDPRNHDILMTLIAKGDLTEDQLTRVSSAGGHTDAQSNHEQIRRNKHDDPFRGTGFCGADNVCH
jgi:RHS repeat-associated protein